MKENEKSLDPQLWHACVGWMVQMPLVNSKVFYFPQGHAEYANSNVDFGALRIPPLVLCRVVAVKFLADPETDEVYARLRLITLRNSDLDFEDDVLDGNASGGSQFHDTMLKPFFPSWIIQIEFCCCCWLWSLALWGLLCYFERGE
ncbi:hypothetical protein RJT34_13092 [Clitoria ternatea]|uniref:Uncharacterized protein n=1 Tax=Clitoria ternatea TaxID=43366 RepID=A0AAN9PLI2_CLITE